MHEIKIKLHAVNLLLSHLNTYVRVFVCFVETDIIDIYFFVIVWPSGTYGIPKSLSGCPLNWQEGWILQDLENTNSQTEFSANLSFHMEATLTGNNVKRSFCVKTSTNNGETRSWPAGTLKVSVFIISAYLLRHSTKHGLTWTAEVDSWTGLLL